jgi:putative transposase
MVGRYAEKIGFTKACRVFGVKTRTHRDRRLKIQRAAYHQLHCLWGQSQESDAPQKESEQESGAVSSPRELTLPQKEQEEHRQASCTDKNRAQHTHPLPAQAAPQKKQAAPQERHIRCMLCVKQEQKQQSVALLEPKAHPWALSLAQRKDILDLLCGERFCDLSPYEVYWSLLDEGIYYCSIRTMYRVLQEHDAARERRRGNHTKHGSYNVPRLCAEAPNQIWSWDVTLFHGDQKGIKYYFYCMMDIFSRKIVGWMVVGVESESNAKVLIKTTCRREAIEKNQLVIHSDRGSIQTAGTVKELLGTLKVTQSLSRPRVSNDNPFSEAAFKTTKYRPDFPGTFSSLQQARRWVVQFVDWYNTEHYHSGIAFHHPTDVHNGSWKHLHKQRQLALDTAFAQRPRQFRKRPFAWEIPKEVWINRPPHQDDMTRQGSTTSHSEQTFEDISVITQEQEVTTAEAS